MRVLAEQRKLCAPRVRAGGAQRAGATLLCARCAVRGADSAGRSNEEADAAGVDEYFAAEDWAEVREEAEREQEAMFRGVLVLRSTAGASSCEWIHSNRKLGQRAHGKVRLVQSRATGELHAIKTFRLKARCKSAIAHVAEREGTLLRMLEHPVRCPAP